MIIQIKKNLSVKRKVEILEKLLLEACYHDYMVEVDYIGMLSKIYPHIADVRLHYITPTWRGRLNHSLRVVSIEPRDIHVNRNIFNVMVETTEQFCYRILEKDMYGNLRINGKKIEY